MAGGPAPVGGGAPAAPVAPPRPSPPPQTTAPAAATQAAAPADAAGVSPQARLEAAGAQFGQSLGSLSPEDKTAMGEIQAKVEAWAQQQESQGKTVDRSSVFVGEAMNYGMNKDPQGQNPQLMGMVDAGSEYVEAYQATQKGGQQPAGQPAQPAPDPGKERQLESLQKQAAQQAEGLPGAGQ